MLHALLQPVAQVPAEVATKAGTTLVESGVLGALLVVSVLGNVALVWLAFKAMNHRVEDTKKLSELSEKMVTTFAGVEKALENLDESSKAQTQVLQSLKDTMNTLLMSAVARGGILPGSNSSPPRVR